MVHKIYVTSATTPLLCCQTVMLYQCHYDVIIVFVCNLLHFNVFNHLHRLIKENEMALQRAEMRMVRWMCGVKLQDRVPTKELRGRLELEDIISVLQRNRLRWYGHVLRKEDNDWVKKCMEYKVEGTRPRGRPKKTWREIVEKDCRACGLNTEDANNFHRAVKRLCVCVCVCVHRLIWAE